MTTSKLQCPHRVSGPCPVCEAEEARYERDVAESVSLYEAECLYGSTGWDEHCEFEAGAENMELRAMRLEAEREAELEAHWAAEEAAEEAEAAHYEVLVADSYEIPTP
ncbi:MAG: hypothetical protein WC565_05225 [Parcubacteria group bacterium]